MSNALNLKTDEAAAAPQGNLPGDVYDLLAAYSKRMKTAVDTGLVAIAEQPKIDAIIARYPGQILLHVLAIRNQMNIQTVRPGRIAHIVRGHLIHIEAAKKHGFPQHWRPERGDTTRIGHALLDLAEGGHTAEAARLLRGVEGLFHNPGAVFGRSYQQLNLQPPAFATTNAPRRRRIKDASGDVWGGHDVQRPDMPTNSQWESWMND